MTLRMRVLPRFPAAISAVNGLKVTRPSGSPNLIVEPDFGSLVQIPSVDDPENVFFWAWDRSLSLYRIMSFADLFAGVTDLGFMTEAIYDPQNIHADAFARANHTGTQAVSTITGLQTALDGKEVKTVYASKSGNYTALATDNNAVHRYTAAATVALTAAATLAANWQYTVVADGADITIDPNGSETINGQTTLTVFRGGAATIICDGTNFFAASVSTPRTARARNRVINGTAQVSQENGGSGVSGGYPADQWWFNASGITGAAVRTTISATPEGTTTAVAMNATVAKPSLAAGDAMQLVLPIEGLDVADLAWGAAGAKQVVLRFAAVCDQTGTFGFSLTNAAGNRSYCGSFTITAINTTHVFSFAIPGDTTGTWAKDNSAGINLHFVYASGTSNLGVPGWQAGSQIAPSGISNGAGVVSKSLFITDVGLYKDVDGTGLPPPYEAPSYEDDLARCLRYFQNFNSSGSAFKQFGMGYYITTTSFVAAMWLKATMRAFPTMSSSAASTFGGTALAMDTTGTDIVRINLTVASATANTPGALQANNTTSAFINFSARLI